MARPEVAHRIKSYSAATGIVYQYTFVEVRPARRGLSRGTEFIYIVSADRKENFPLAVFVRASAVEKWSKREGRKLSGTEEYAVAKMVYSMASINRRARRLTHPDLFVDETNLDSPLQKLDLYRPHTPRLPADPTAPAAGKTFAPATELSGGAESSRWRRDASAQGDFARKTRASRKRDPQGHRSRAEPRGKS